MPGGAKSVLTDINHKTKTVKRVRTSSCTAFIKIENWKRWFPQQYIYLNADLLSFIPGNFLFFSFSSPTANIKVWKLLAADMTGKNNFVGFISVIICHYKWLCKRFLSISKVQINNVCAGVSARGLLGRWRVASGKFVTDIHAVPLRKWRRCQQAEGACDTLDINPGKR